MRGMCVFPFCLVRKIDTSTGKVFRISQWHGQVFSALIRLVDHGNVFGLFTIENGEVHGGLGSSGATRRTANGWWLGW